MKKSTETPARPNETVKSHKPPFRPAVDDTKPVLQDPVRISLSVLRTLCVFDVLNDDI